MMAIFRAAPILVVLLRASSVWAQEREPSFLLSQPPSADLEWNSTHDGSWDASWDRSWAYSTAPFTLSLRAGLRSSGSMRTRAAPFDPTSSRSSRDYYALATLQVPLDEIVPSNAGAGAETEPTPSTATTSQGFERKRPEDSVSALQVLEQDMSATSHPAAQDEATLRRMRLAKEITSLLRMLTLKAAEASEEGNSLSELGSMQRRSRWSGLVPELRLRGVYGFDQSVSQEENNGLYPGDSTTRGGRDSLLEARLTFRLDRLIYGDRESTLYQKRVDLLREGAKRDQLLVDLLADWLAARRHVAEGLLLPDELLKELAKQERALLGLNELSGGWFLGEATLIEMELRQLLSPPDSPLQLEEPAAMLTDGEPQKEEQKAD